MALLTVPVCGAFLCLLLFQASSALISVHKDESRIALAAESALDEINRKCGSGQPCGAIALAEKTISHSSDLVIQSQKAIRDADQVTLAESAMLPTWNARMTSTMDGVDAATVAFAGTAHQATADLQTADSVIGSAQLLVGHLDAVAASSNETVKHFDALLTDPSVVLTMGNVSRITATSEHMLVTADAVETKATQTYLHPSTNPLHRTWQYLSPFLLPAAQIGAATVR